MRKNIQGKRKKLIIVLCGILFFMAVGYAAFAANLNIKGTTNISTSWDVRITNITSKNIVGTASNLEEPSYTNLTAEFYTGLVSPGDSIEYDITVTNSGNIDAKLDKITITDSNNPAIIFTTSGLIEGDGLAVGESKVLTVKVEYSNSVTSQPENTESSIEVTLDFSQIESTPEVIQIDATYHEAYYSCSSGTLEGTRCRITTTDTTSPSSSSSTCPSGYVEIDGVCYYDLDVSTMRACTGLADSEWNATLKVCYDPLTTKDKVPGCPSGYTYNSSANNCQKPVTTYQNATHHEAYYSCPDGYNLQGDKCIK